MVPRSFYVHMSTGTKGEAVDLQTDGGNVKIEYNVLREFGPDHAKQFEVEVKCNNKLLATGTGKSKKIAEMEAAKKALENIN